jgi:GT2 family glycosyltransferase
LTRSGLIRRSAVAATRSAAAAAVDPLPADSRGATLGDGATPSRPRLIRSDALPDLPPTAPTERASEAPDREAPTPEYEIAVVVLTQGTRPTELARAIASIRAQEQVDPQLLLVVNGMNVVNGAAPPLDGRPDQPDELIVLDENVGIPGGRNIGAAAADARLIMFLDDDAELLDPGLLAAVVDRFKANPRLGAMSIRLVDEEGHTQRRHVPRLGSRSAEKSGPVTYFVGGASVVRAKPFREVDGFDARFFYAMEESDLSWRLLDAGWSIWYSADLLVFHPRTSPARHPGYALLTARNRAWMAWRSLPGPVLAGYLVVWTIAAAVRGAPLREVLAGYREASAARPPRRPIRWRTVAKMTLLGRPPLF